MASLCDIVCHCSKQVVGRTNRMGIAGEMDMVTPAEDVAEMYKRTKKPKMLKVIPGISHYDVYEEPYLSQVTELAKDWLKEHLG